jgi:hypothetical protein
MPFTEEDKYWFEIVKENPTDYQILIDNDSVWVETDDNETYENICVYTFSSYGYDFIYGLLNYLGINADMC